MPLKTFFFFAFLLFFWSLSVFKTPFAGVLAYLINYNISPANQWWGKPLSDLGIRFVFYSYVFLLLGVLFHRRKVKFYGLDIHEILFLLFIILLWFSHFIAPTHFLLGNSIVFERNALKLTKVFLFLFFFIRCITNRKQFDILISTYVVLLLIQGYFAWHAPETAFFRGRLDLGFGGPDFKDSNFLAAHFASFLPFIAVSFLEKRNIWLRVLCLLSLIFSLNAIILTRTRGVFLALICAFCLVFILSCIFRRYFKYMLLIVTSTSVLFLTLVDPSFWERIYTIRKYGQEASLDKSAATRLIIWKAALKMIKKYPLGVGDGQFKLFIGDFDDRVIGRDAHNTFVRCAGELGVPGLIIFCLFVFNAFRYTINLCLETYSIPFFFSFSVACFFALFIRLISSLFSTHLYVEEFYILFFFPLLLKRLITEHQKQEK